MIGLFLLASLFEILWKTLSNIYGFLRSIYAFRLFRWWTVEKWQEVRGGERMDDVPDAEQDHCYSTACVSDQV